MIDDKDYSGSLKEVVGYCGFCRVLQGFGDLRILEWRVLAMGYNAGGLFICYPPPSNVRF